MTKRKMRKLGLLTFLGLSLSMLVGCGSSGGGGGGGNTNPPEQTETYDPQIKAIYDLAKAAGATNLSYEEWIKSIKGAAGENGLTPEIGSNGNWWIGNYDTGVKAQGPEGPQGPQGEPGSTWLTGSGTPSATQGNNGDLYLDTDTSDIYLKQNNRWTLIGNLKGAPGQEGTSFRSGAGEPSDDLGNDGDSYLDYLTWNFYVKENGTWLLKGNMAAGGGGDPVITYQVSASISAGDLEVGESRDINIQITPEVSDLNAALRSGDLVLTSSNPNVAKIQGLKVVGNNVGTAIITVKYKGYGSSFSVTVKEAVTASGIRIDTNPTTTEYTVGDTFSIVGLKVSLVYSDGTSETLNNNDLEISEPDMSTAGSKTVFIKYSGFTASFTITVKAAEARIIAINIQNLPKTDYYVGDELSYTGLLIKAEYSDGTVGNLDLSLVRIDTSKVDMSKAGKYTIYIYYNSFSCLYQITVKEVPTGNVTLDLFAYNDFHGNVTDTSGKGLGIGKTSTLLKQLTSGKNSIFLSQGDMWQGSVESNYTRGLLVTEWMNYMDFKQLTLGNHEFDWTVSEIYNNQAIANFPTLGINVIDTRTGTRLEGIDASTTFTTAGVKVGVIGAIGDCLGSISASKIPNINFYNGSRLTSLIKAESTRLREEEGCDIIIYSFHGDTNPDHATDNKDVNNYDISLSTENYVDIVFEGHKHMSYDYTDAGGVHHYEALSDNKSFRQVTVSIDLTKSSNKLTVTDSNEYFTNNYSHLNEDEYANALLEKYYDYYSFAYQDLGYNSKYRSRDELRQICADLYIKAGLEEWGNEYNIVLGGGYTSCRSQGIGVGYVRYGTLAEAFPFDNDVQLCSIKGTYLLSRFINTTHEDYFISYSEYGERVKDSIDANETYYIIADTYSSDYTYNNLTVVDSYKGGGVYARDLMAQDIMAGNWGTAPGPDDPTPPDPTQVVHAGTASDPYTMDDAYALATISPDNASWGFFRGTISNLDDAKEYVGYMEEIYFGLSNGSQIRMYRGQKYDAAQRNADRFTKSDITVGDEIIFYGGTKCYNGVPQFVSVNVFVTRNGYPMNDGKDKSKPISVTDFYMLQEVYGSLTEYTVVGNLTSKTFREDVNYYLCHLESHYVNTAYPLYAYAIYLDEKESNAFPIQSELIAYVNMETYTSEILNMPDESKYGSYESPLSVVEAIALLEEVVPTSGTYTSQDVYVTGVISSVEYKGQYDSYYIWLYNGEEERGFQIYSAKLADGVDASQLVAGATICVYGLGMIYNGTTYEITYKGSVSPIIYSIA